MVPTGATKVTAVWASLCATWDHTHSGSRQRVYIWGNRTAAWGSGKRRGGRHSVVVCLDGDGHGRPRQGR